MRRQRRVAQLDVQVLFLYNTGQQKGCPSTMNTPLATPLGGLDDGPGFPLPRPSPSSTRACSVLVNYVQVVFQREKAWSILSRNACRDLRKMTFSNSRLFNGCGFALLRSMKTLTSNTSKRHGTTLDDSSGTNHVIKSTRPSPSEKPSTRFNMHGECVRAGWRRHWYEAISRIYAEIYAYIPELESQSYIAPFSTHRYTLPSAYFEG